MSKRYTASTARAEFADIISRAEYAGEQTIIHRRNRAVAAVVPIEDLKLIERMENAIDIAEANKAMKEKGENVSWEQIKKELKL
jgi:prevent-host-death family protein